MPQEGKEKERLRRESQVCQGVSGQRRRKKLTERYGNRHHKGVENPAPQVLFLRESLCKDAKIEFAHIGDQRGCDRCSLYGQRERKEQWEKHEQ